MDDAIKKPSKRPSLGDLRGMAPPAASLAHDTVRELERLSGGRASAGHAAGEAPVVRQADEAPPEPAPAAVRGEPEDEPQRRRPAARSKGAPRWTEDDLRRALLEDAEVESVWVKFATQVRIETRERLNAFVLHGKRKRFNSTRIQDVVDAALSRYLDEQGFAREDGGARAAA